MFHMPELPEVEVTRLSLADRLLGARLVWVRLGKPLRWPLGIAPQTLHGARLGAMQRRGKYLWLPLLPADGPHVTVPEPAPNLAPGLHGGPGLLLHLGMSGALQFDATLRWPCSAAGAAPDLPPLPPHVHLQLGTDQGLLGLHDPRRFGAAVWSAAPDQAPAATLLARLGDEPFDPSLTPERFHARLQRRRCAIKLALLAGDIVVGAGNIYVSEALHRAGIDPRARADRISRPRAAALLAALRETLGQAIALGGSTLRDFRDVHGMAGAFQQQALVYAREGEACRRCGATVRRIVQGQRSTFFCAGCQRR
ncbi:MAG: formamidopyrimidine-DNA glycosylase/DNA-(apurinic or apyrimidinic site) lyase MutM [Pseudomonadota bacterium]|jgi:formamidopyrimidine-DNA glycosylase